MISKQLSMSFVPTVGRVGGHKVGSEYMRSINQRAKTLRKATARKKAISEKEEVPENQLSLPFNERSKTK